MLSAPRAQSANCRRDFTYPAVQKCGASSDLLPAAASFLLSLGSVTGGSLVLIDPVTHAATVSPFTNLLAGNASTEGIVYDPVLDMILITTGPTGTTTQNRIAQVNLQGTVIQVSPALNVPDDDELAFNPATQLLYVADFNSATGVQSITNIFTTPTLIPFAASPNDSSLGYPAFSDSGQLFLARLGSRQLFTLSGNSYVPIGPFGTTADVQSLAFAPLEPFAAVPEPGTALLVAMGFASLGLSRRSPQRRKLPVAVVEHPITGG